MKPTPLFISLDAQDECDVSSQGGEHRLDGLAEVDTWPDRWRYCCHRRPLLANRRGHFSSFVAVIVLYWGCFCRQRRPGRGARAYV